MNIDQIIAMAMCPKLSTILSHLELETNDCRHCIHKRDVPANCHIECVKPDPLMTGDLHGIRSGWFMYPLLFDPTWMTKQCDNFESVNLAVESSGKPE